MYLDIYIYIYILKYKCLFLIPSNRIACDILFDNYITFLSSEIGYFIISLSIAHEKVHERTMPTNLFSDLNACHVVKKSNIAQGKTNSVTSSCNDI